MRFYYHFSVTISKSCFESSFGKLRDITSENLGSSAILRKTNREEGKEVSNNYTTKRTTSVARKYVAFPLFPIRRRLKTTAKVGIWNSNRGIMFVITKASLEYYTFINYLFQMSALSLSIKIYVNADKRLEANLSVK